MEGREKPPKAAHPFPDGPISKKFFGTPSAPAFAKLMAKVFGVYFILLGINTYLTRSDMTLLGFKVLPSKEELQLRFKMLTAERPLHLWMDNLNLHSVQKNNENKITDQVQFLPPIVIPAVPSNPLGSGIPVKPHPDDQ